MGIVALLCIPIYVSFRIGQWDGKRSAWSEADTVILDHYDTEFVPKPVYFTKTITDTMWLPLPAPGDTTESVNSIPLEREQLHYKDSSYEAWVSGYKPSLDSISIFTHSQTIFVDHVPDIRKKTHWGIGIQAGYGASVYNKEVVMTPYIGIGISYNILSW